MKLLKRLLIFLLALVGLTCLLLLLPVLLSCVLISEVIEQRKKVRAAKSFHCPDCGAVVHKAGVQLADAAWEKQMAAERLKHPRRKFRRLPRMVRWLHAICPECGKRFSYLSKEQRYVPDKTKPPDEQAVE